MLGYIPQNIVTRGWDDVQKIMETFVNQRAPKKSYKKVLIYI